MMFLLRAYCFEAHHLGAEKVADLKFRKLAPCQLSQEIPSSRWKSDKKKVFLSMDAVTEARFSNTLLNRVHDCQFICHTMNSR